MSKRRIVPILTKRDLEAIDAALAMMLAGAIEDRPRSHYEGAQEKVHEMLGRAR